MGVGKPGALGDSSLAFAGGLAVVEELRAPRRGHLCAPARVGEGGVRARVGGCLRVRLDAGARLSLAPLERGECKACGSQRAFCCPGAGWASESSEMDATVPSSLASCRDRRRILCRLFLPSAPLLLAISKYFHNVDGFE